jgi:hypothetical protein
VGSINVHLELRRVMNRPLYCCLAIAGLAFPIQLSAQSQGEGLASLVPDLILRGITLPGADNPGRPHAGHFTLGNPTFGDSQTESKPDVGSIRAVEAFGDRLRAQFANFPLGSSTGGFTYSFDAASGIYTRSSQSFGPAFTERAATVGRRKLSLGVNYQHTSFDTFGGESLRDGSVTFYLPHTDCCPNVTAASPQDPGFEGDVVEAALTLKATTDTLALFANYGLTNRLDVGLAIPLTRVDLEANVRARILRLSSSDNLLVHTFVDGEDVIVASFSRSGSATGIGDVLVRTKYNFMRAADAGLSLGVDLRLPTGEENDLLGLGTTQAKFLFIASSASDRLSPHLNIGFTLSGEGTRESSFGFEPPGVSDEFNYSGGVEFVAYPRLTILADFLGRTLIDAGTVELEPRTFEFRPGAAALGSVTPRTSTINPLTGEPYRQLALEAGRNLTLLLGSAGFKFNAATNLLVMANVLFPLNSAGLRDRLTFAFGMDYAF